MPPDAGMSFSLRSNPTSGHIQGVLVFIDESGDPGFRTERGSSPIFAVAMVIFENGDDARATEEIIKGSMVDLRVHPEFRFNKSSSRVRDGFFWAVYSCPFLVRAIVVRKEDIYSPFLKAYKEDFYRFVVQQMIKYDDGTLNDARVAIDGSGEREFKRRLRTSLRRQLGARLKAIKFARSQSDPLVQLADMCVGAIARSYRSDRKDASRWRRMLQPRINDIWEFR